MGPPECFKSELLLADLRRGLTLSTARTGDKLLGFITFYRVLGSLRGEVVFLIIFYLGGALTFKVCLGPTAALS